MAERGMGRGLAAILSVAPRDQEDLRRIPTDLVVANPRQPRTSFDDETLQTLADSVRERGILQPVLVRPLPGGRYELIAGERRWRAAQLAGLDELPALVRDRDDAEGQRQTQRPVRRQQPTQVREPLPPRELRRPADALEHRRLRQGVHGQVQ